MLANKVLPACAVLVLERLRKAAKVGKRGGKKRRKVEGGKEGMFWKEI